MLSVFYAKYRKKLIMLSGIMLSLVMLSLVMLSDESPWKAWQIAMLERPMCWNMVLQAFIRKALQSLMDQVAWECHHSGSNVIKLFLGAATAKRHTV
jgi:hypothetical protein